MDFVTAGSTALYLTDFTDMKVSDVFYFFLVILPVMAYHVWKEVREK